MQNRRDFIKTAIAAGIIPSLTLSSNTKYYKSFNTPLRINTIKAADPNSYVELQFHDFYVSVKDNITTFFVPKINYIIAKPGYDLSAFNSSHILDTFYNKEPFLLYYGYDPAIGRQGLLHFNFNTNYKVYSIQPDVKYDIAPEGSGVIRVNWDINLKIQCHIKHIIVHDIAYELVDMYTINIVRNNMDFLTSLNTHFHETPTHKEGTQWLR